jgi:hypothetical protein
MKEICLTLVLITLTTWAMAQDQRFFTSEEAMEWLPQLIGYNLEVIGEQNDKGIKATDEKHIEFLFMTDAREKAQKLKATLEGTEGYQLYRVYSLEGFWIVTGEVRNLLMHIGEFNEWTMELCKTGFDHDVKLLSWNFLDEERTKKIDGFWEWFRDNQDEFQSLDPTDREATDRSFQKLIDHLQPIHGSLVFEFSMPIEDGSREFVLSAGGDRAAFPDLIQLYRRAPELDKWIITPFKQGFDGDPQLEFNNGYKLSWDKVKFTSEETAEGLSLDFYIKGYDKSNEDFMTGLIILLDSYLGEYDAVTQIRYVDVHRLDKKNTKHLQKFEKLKEVVESYKQKKNGK